MPVSRDLPYQWWDTPNIHLCTIQDFRALCREEGLCIEQEQYLRSVEKPPPARLVAPEPPGAHRHLRRHPLLAGPFAAAAGFLGHGPGFRGSQRGYTTSTFCASETGASGTRSASRPDRAPARRASRQKERQVPQGKVKWFSTEKAFGFIEQENDNDIFVHVTGLADGVTAIDKDMLVEYEVEQGRKGPQATNVRPVAAGRASRAAAAEVEHRASSPTSPRRRARRAHRGRAMSPATSSRRAHESVEPERRGRGRVTTRRLTGRPPEERSDPAAGPSFLPHLPAAGTMRRHHPGGEHDSRTSTGSATTVPAGRSTVHLHRSVEAAA